MSRSVGVVDAVHSIVPEEAAVILGLLTQLGDIWFLLVVVTLAYWLRPSDRERTAVVLAIAIGTIALVQGLKGLFDLPRPTTPLANADAYPVLLHGLVEATATAGGHGFPSGHATLSTAVLLALAGAVRIGDPRRRSLLAATLLVVISLSRILLGVHFLVDVVAGALIALAVLTGTALALRSSPVSGPTTAFGLAVALGVAAVALTAPTPDLAGAFADPAHDSALSLGAAVGAFGGWQVSRALEHRSADSAREGGDAVQLGDRDAAQPGEGVAAQLGDGDASPPGASGHVLLAIGPLLALLAVGVGGLLVGEHTAAATGGAGFLFAGIVALPALVPAFDDVVAGYVPGWLRDEAIGPGE